MFADVRLDCIGERDLFDPSHDREKFKHIVRALRRKQRHAQAETALTLHVNGEQVRAGSHRHPKLTAPQRGIADVSGKRGEHPARDAAVPRIHIARAEHGVGFVHDHDHRPQRADGHQNSRLLPLGVAHPFRAELTQFHDRQSALAGKTIHEK